MIRAKKSLGQHWLTNKGVLEKIAAAGNLSASDTVLEVGPGTGNLTALLLARAGKVIAVEKDENLVKILQEKFAGEINPPAGGKKLEIFSADILTVSPTALGLANQPYKVIANLPYYLTGEFLRLWLGRVPQPSLMVLLLQKEVVERIVARDGKESLLSLSVKLFGEPKMLGTVKAGSFSPAPAVDSAILLIENIDREKLTGIDEGKFFALLKKGFAHKRKLLQNNLGKDVAALIPSDWRKARAEDLKLADWLKLAKSL
ncbi:MAG: 16S rRNA (adenine(1518)-N(6)/adenine(1519)-N(6))-dimethyltransferase RsmA [Patescibacteria group bacterium]